MKSNKGITLVSLAIYILVMMIVLGVMNSIITNFYNNTEGTNKKVEDMVEFNNFNNYFLKEVKQYNNDVDSINNESNYILFKSGNSFLFNNNKIYYNNIVICNNVENVIFEYLTSNNGNKTKDETIISVTLQFENFSKTINYKVENIY